MANKYGAKKIHNDGYTFDSGAEHRRYQQLKLLLAAGEIANLIVHPRYLIFDDYRRVDGRQIRAVYYQADFEYQDNLIMEIVTEDVKGGAATQTPLFRLKRKLFEARYERVLQIVEA